MPFTFNFQLSTFHFSLFTFHFRGPGRLRSRSLTVSLVWPARGVAAAPRRAVSALASALAAPLIVLLARRRNVVLHVAGAAIVNVDRITQVAKSVRQGRFRGGAPRRPPPRHAALVRCSASGVGGTVLDDDRGASGGQRRALDPWLGLASAHSVVLTKQSRGG